MVTVKHFLDEKEKWNNEKPWLIIGKGPTFSKIFDRYLPLHEYNIMGLNHVAEKIYVDITHIIDFSVVNSRIVNHSQSIVFPWHVHINHNVTNKPLTKFINDYTPTKELKKLDNVYWYNLSTWKGIHNETEHPIIKTRFFSAEAAFHLLALAGVKKIRSLGIDGGTEYAKEFSKLKPLTNGQPSFSLQDKRIKEIVKKFNIDYEVL